MNATSLDQPNRVRKGEEINTTLVSEFLNDSLDGFDGNIRVSQFHGGYSNLTYLIETSGAEYVLRKPPHGANITSAHDMEREFAVLKTLQHWYNKIPCPILFCSDKSIVGTPFYIMERVKGSILRNHVSEELATSYEFWKLLSEQTIENLAEIHSLDIVKTGLIKLGKPEGYTNRQVTGWVDRYFAAETDSLIDMNHAADWLQSNLPTHSKTAFIHNDYKYDNLVLDMDNSRIIAVLDWEMSTVGDPLMDLGTSLGYWGESNSPAALKPFSLTWLEGNLNRQQVVELYAGKTGASLENIVFYYVFGCFKIGAIVQQIYARYKKGITKDPRFASLLSVVEACALNAKNAIFYDRINNFY